MTFAQRLLTSSLVAALGTTPVVALAQAPAQTPAPPPAASVLAPADAAPLIGDWTISAEGPNGPATFLLTVKVADGKVAGEISSDAMAKTAITDITKSGSAVLLRYAFDYQGTNVPTVITLTPAGETLKTVIDFADGAYTMNGTASRKKL